MSISQRLRTAAAVLVTAAATGLLPVAMATPAEAAACSTASGVTVVVEPGGLGGGTQVDCLASGGGKTAARLLQDAGHSLTYVQRFPGFVCRIDGAPADDPCVNTPPADAYWGLWWSNGTSGEWAYSSLGAGSLTIPSGGYVAMVWDGSSGTVRPQTAAVAHPAATPTPKPSPTPTAKPTPRPTAPPTTESTAPPTGQATSEAPPGGTAGTAGPDPSATGRPTRSGSESAATDPSPATSDSPDQQAEAGAAVDGPVVPVGDSSAAPDDGLPPWLAPLLVAVLLGGAGAVSVARRRRRP